jgi:hypothetical protein
LHFEPHGDGDDVSDLKARYVRATKERPASDSAGSGTIDVATLDVLVIAAPKPEKSGKTHEAQQTLVEAVVVVRVGWRVSGVLGHGPRRGADARHAD